MDGHYPSPELTFTVTFIYFPQKKHFFPSCFLSRCSTAAASHLKMIITTCVWRVRGTRTPPTSRSATLPSRRTVKLWGLHLISTPGSNRQKAALFSAATTVGSTDGGPRSSQTRGWRCGPWCASCQPRWRCWPSCWILKDSPTRRGPSFSSPCAVICTVLLTWYERKYLIQICFIHKENQIRFLWFYFLILLF